MQSTRLHHFPQSASKEKSYIEQFSPAFHSIPFRIKLQRESNVISSWKMEKETAEVRYKYKYMEFQIQNFVQCFVEGDDDDDV